MKISSGVEMLKIAANLMGKPTLIHPTLIWDKDTMILVDAGYPGQLSLIREAIAKTDVPFAGLNMIILTHQDIDHVGSLPDILKELPNGAKVLAHEQESAYIQGEKIPIKVAQLEARVDSLSEDMKSFYERLKAGFQSCKVHVDKTLVDNEELPCCGGITVIYAPGHTPGHICLYLRESKTLIAGDLLTIEAGMLVKPSSFSDFDSELSLQSITKLTKFDIETIICYHGGLYQGNANSRIKELAEQTQARSL